MSNSNINNSKNNIDFWGNRCSNLLKSEIDISIDRSIDNINSNNKELNNESKSININKFKNKSIKKRSKSPMPKSTKATDLVTKTNKNKIKLLENKNNLIFD